MAISALALGSGANTAIFPVVTSILLQPLPYAQPDRLVRMVLKFPNGSSPTTSVPKFMAWKDGTTAFQFACAYNFSGPGLNLGGGSMPEQVKGIHVSADFFPVFAATPALGRTFSANEDRPDGPRWAVMSHGLWVRRFGGDPRIIGRVILLGGEPWTVIVVLRAYFRSYPPLAALGVYGMLSYSVQQRSQEIGIRMALGAQRADVLKRVVGHGMAMAGLGIAIGLAGAYGLSRLLTALLFGVKPNDPLTFAAVALVLALISLGACWIPARRATRVDPLLALRYE